MNTTIYNKICNDHEYLVLEYQKAEALFREGFSLSLSTEEFKARNQARKDAFNKLKEFEANFPPGSLDTAYKRTNRINYRKEPEKSPYAKSKDPERIAKNTIQDYFYSMVGQPFEAKISTSDLLVSLSLLQGEEERIIFHYAATLDSKEKNKPEPKIFMFACWRVPEKIIKKAAPPDMMVDGDRIFTQPLAQQPAKGTVIEALFDWVGIDLVENQLKSSLPNWSGLKKEMHEGIKNLKYDPDSLAKKFPEISRYLR